MEAPTFVALRALRGKRSKVLDVYTPNRMIARGVVLIAIAALMPTPSTPLAQAINERIARSGAEVAVAFETLDGRDHLFIRADDPFHAASTMKVPVMIELFREAHAGRLSLADHVPIVNQF